MQVVDVGGGTGFCTLGIVKTVKAANVTLLDQSDHQMAKAEKKKELADVIKVQGDAEDLPFGANRFDRYVSAGSIEYWPEPQRGITVRLPHLEIPSSLRKVSSQRGTWTERRRQIATP